ncbi:MAG: hypothetical protein LBQ84_06460 [Flavobacteriaceae bacterium]|nr:hypothetical protein [Flavobacteriaceae bacterium]
MAISYHCWRSEAITPCFQVCYIPVSYSPEGLISITVGQRPAERATSQTAA